MIYFTFHFIHYNCLCCLHIYSQGTTDRCHPDTPEPDKWIYCHSENHWQQKHTMREFVDRILVADRLRVIEEKGLPETQKAIR